MGEGGGKVSVLFTWLPRFLWLSHTKVLSTQIHFGVIIPKACNNTQSNITFFTSLRCMLIFFSCCCEYSRQLCLLPLESRKFTSVYHHSLCRCLAFCGLVTKHICCNPQQLLSFIVLPHSSQEFSSYIFVHPYMENYIHLQLEHSVSYTDSN
jgi:hypothetical protein